MSKAKVRPLRSPTINRPVGWSSHAWAVSGPGRWIFTSGFTARDENGPIIHLGDPGAQTRLTCENLRRILAEDGATLDHVVKIICYVVKREHFEAVRQARIEYFPNNPPASTTVVGGLIDPDALVEIEAVAFVPEADGKRG